MAKPQEVCEVEVNGKLYRDWESVRVQVSMGESYRYANLLVTEKVVSGAGIAAMQIAPGDKVVVRLAGQTVLTGLVAERQAAYDAQTHGVLILVVSLTALISHSSVPMKASQYRGYTFSAIAGAVLQPLGVSVQFDNPPTGVTKPFKEVSVIPGESVWSFVERLGRTRSVILSDNADGNLVASQRDSNKSATASLDEGRNILAANCRITDLAAKERVVTLGQQRGDDNTSGELARKPAAFVDNPNAKWPLQAIIPVEEPGDLQDMQARANHERDALLSDTIDAQITIQGWLKDSGELWDIKEIVHVTSPMLMLDHDLQVSTVSFEQNSGGTRTTLGLIRQGQGVIAQDPGVTAGNGNSLPGTTQEAQPDP